MSRHLRLIALCAGLLAAAGCGDERRLPTGPTVLAPTGPTEPSAPPPPSGPQRLAALALFESASVHAGVTTSPLTWAASQGKVLFDGPCAFESGAFKGTLDGGLSPIPGTLLPTGSHTYVASFSNCLVAWWGVELNGVASAAYNAADWSNITATVSAESVRGVGLASGAFSELFDVTADGSAVWTSVRSSTTTETYTPAIGSRLVNNTTSNVAIFGGGSFSLIRYPGNRWDQRFHTLMVAVNGTEYTLDGNLEMTIGSDSRGTPSHTGEVRITNNGTLVARIFGLRGALTIEILVPLVPL